MWQLLRWQLAAVSVGAAAIHFAEIVPHLAEYRPFGVFFVAVAWFQALWAVLVIANESRGLRAAGLLVNAVVVGIWIWSRTLGLPIGPEAGTPEQAQASDTLATAFEALIVLWTTLSFVPFARSRQPSRGVVVASAVLVWTVVVLLTTLVFLLEAETGGGHPAF